ncbi:hypothetical protein N658DRAFT_117662 [Parathielavia hyrcaniae]|uniref:Uncharacterized protein n=1 Tax=Parathielavia hyrcaniae TaxID=113614 RepID=A0AAN6Q887_9PEZI|nr:hypothetical protein N658DRAFT_117662 [Parathielavia hyrcaniae]
MSEEPMVLVRPPCSAGRQRKEESWGERRVVAGGEYLRKVERQSRKLQYMSIPSSRGAMPPFRALGCWLHRRRNFRWFGEKCWIIPLSSLDRESQADKAASARAGRVLNHYSSIWHSSPGWYNTTKLHRWVTAPCHGDQGGSIKLLPRPAECLAKQGPKRQEQPRNSWRTSLKTLGRCSLSRIGYEAGQVEVVSRTESLEHGQWRLRAGYRSRRCRDRAGWV